MDFFGEYPVQRWRPPGRPREEDAGVVFARRHALARAAVRVAKRSGLDHVAARAVAAEARVARASIHHWFASTDDLRAEMVLSLDDDVDGALAALRAITAAGCDRSGRGGPSRG
jgi:DNA-binding transcriptional regulator YbjK